MGEKSEAPPAKPAKPPRDEAPPGKKKSKKERRAEADKKEAREAKKRGEPVMAKIDLSEQTKKFVRYPTGQKSTKEKVKFQPQERNRRLVETVRKDERVAREAVERLAMAEMLNTTDVGYLEAEGREKTHQYSQSMILQNVDCGTAAKKFDLALPYGPYAVDFERNGRHLVFGGDKGQIAMIDCHSMELKCEVQVEESVRDVKFLQSSALFAVAQRHHAFIYDHQGVEIHCLRDHKAPNRLEFLPYHMLLAIGGEQDYLHYRDISTGEVVAKHKTFNGPCTALKQNPRNAVIHSGSNRGVVSLWTPNVKEAVMKIKCHGGSITDIAVDGNYMVTGATDARWKVWDLRKFETTAMYRTWGYAPASLDISGTGIVSVGYGFTVELWKDAMKEHVKYPYLSQTYPRMRMSAVRFRPFEDVLAIGHSGGIGSAIVPGAGYANYDSFEANPFETKKQRRETEVRQLLEKLQPDTIVLDPSTIGAVNKELAAVTEQEKKAAEVAEVRQRKRQRGKSKIGRKESASVKEYAKEMRKRTKQRLADEKEGEKIRAEMKKKAEAPPEDPPGLKRRPKEKGEVTSISAPDPVPEQSGALARFNKKPRTA